MRGGSRNLTTAPLRPFADYPLILAAPGSLAQCAADPGTEWAPANCRKSETKTEERLIGMRARRAARESRHSP